MTPTTAKQIVINALNDKDKLVEVTEIYEHWYKIDITYLTRMVNSREPDPQLQDDPIIETETITKVVDRYITEQELTEKIELLTFKECKYE